MSSPAPVDEQAFAQWHQNQQQRIADYVRGIGVFDTDVTGEWQWIIPFRGMLGQIRPKQGSSPMLWIVTGLLPTDHLELNAAKNCREAARYFALKWQLEAVRLQESGSAPTPRLGKIDWNEMESNLAERAGWLYDLMQDNRRWKPNGLPVMRIDHPASQL